MALYPQSTGAAIQSPANSGAAALVPYALRPWQLARLLGRNLLLLPHSDDECNLAGLLQAHCDCTVLFLTDSAPRDPQYWHRYTERERYRNIRRLESEAALSEYRVRHFHVSDLSGQAGPIDQELHRHLHLALAVARAVIAQLTPETLLVPAYEGGHPDHDAAAFIGAQLARESGLQLWEVPYYHRTSSGKLKRQEFLAHHEARHAITLALSPAEIERKRQFWAQYASQACVLGDFSVERELYRPAPAYDFTLPPHAGKLNYEIWEWAVAPADLITSFSAAATSTGILPPLSPVTRDVVQASAGL